MRNHFIGENVLLTDSGFCRIILPLKMYDWDTAYVSKILHDSVYAGNLIVAERPTKTMHFKKRQYIPFAEREVIHGTHEPIIEQNRWNNVQKILQSRPPAIGKSSSGYDNIFRGIIKCADCGSAMLAKVELSKSPITTIQQILEERDMKSALELGKDIIKNDRGDDYLQATVWDFLFIENQEDMLEAREKEPGKALLNDVIVDLTDNKVNISSRLLKRLTDTYMSIDSEDKWYMYCDFEAFCRQYV